jgi:hypothetical protein
VIKKWKTATRKRRVELAASVLLPLLVLISAVLDHSGVIDHWRGLDLVQRVADRFKLSYADMASYPVYPDNPAWKPTLKLIETYTKVSLRTDKQPLIIARRPATFSAKDPNSSAEWTAPSTLVVLSYTHIPLAPGEKFDPDLDQKNVGDIGELQSWIEQSKADFHFKVNDVFIGVLSVALAYWLWHMK